MNATSLSDPAQESPKLQSPAKSEKPDDLVVFFTHHEGQCSECQIPFFKGEMIQVERQRPLCLDCADLGQLEYLPRGNTALTRRASKHSTLRAVVVEWSRSRKRYERQGILATPQAIARAEAECEADADIRERRRMRAVEARAAGESTYVAAVTAAIRTQFPGCPADEAAQIAAWTCGKHSGRVGRSAAAKQFDGQALRLAVVARIRHEHTRYDALLMDGVARDAARQCVWSKINEILGRWELNPAQ